MSVSIVNKCKNLNKQVILDVPVVVELIVAAVKLIPVEAEFWVVLYVWVEKVLIKDDEVVTLILKKKMILSKIQINWRPFQ